MSYGDKTLVGVGGWLAFFCLAMGILSPIRAVVEVLAISGDPDVEAVFGESWGIVQGLGWGLTALSVLGAWFLVWRLMKVESWQTVRIVIAGIWILGLGISALDILLAAWFSGFRIIDVAAATAQDLIRSLIFAVVWTAYFLRSERVANTYLREPDEEDLQQVFG